MQTYFLLFCAIIMEVIGTMLLPASQNFSKPVPTFVLMIAYAFSFYFLAIVSQKLPLSVVYASWSGIGMFSKSNIHLEDPTILALTYQRICDHHDFHREDPQ